MRILFCLLGISFALAANAQDLLTPDEAVKIAIENNYDIRIAKNDLKVDQTNKTIGNAGMLPSVTASVIDNNSIQSSEQIRNDGTQQSLDNARNSNLNYGAALEWTVFDGLGMFARYDQLKEIEKQGQAEFQLMVMTRASDVLTAYYDLVQQKQQLAALDTTLIISRSRVDLAQNRFTIGKSSKLEVLNAEVDFNTDQTNLLRAKETYANSKIALNELMARDTKTEFDVIDEITADNTLLLPDLETLAQKQNPALQVQLINKRIAEYNLRAVKAQRYPVVSVSTGYNFVETQNSLGFTQRTSSNGLAYGFSANLNIFNGFNQNRNEKVAKLQIENSKLLIDQQSQAIMSQLGSAYQTYLTNISLIDLESQNEEIAKENLYITMEKYRIGTIPTIEYRTAQLNYVNAQLRHSVAKYNAKISEITLRELAGNLSF
ncbi:TolC family protein [Flavobacterium selenitireducens]|uniref:TolC family protein n=1 Tax=Flavobacterium selenitireducens TaxID=2722704 RepID=UPI00168B4ACB|nr:TolC family protein [Flavobacterium selenitireducens]MBD3581144.1 TolC family protein [Flavobacterium selenitireducens]